MSAQSDLALVVGSDLSLSAVNDLATVSGMTLGQQRLLRRLMTNPGDYIWHPEYGAGVPRYVGTVLNIPAMQAAIKAQCYLEASVARTPAPVITITQNLDKTFLRIDYTDVELNAPVVLAFSLTAN